MNKKLPAWIVLTLISLVAALALGATYNGTKDRIARQEAEKAVAVRQELLPQAADFKEVLGNIDSISGATYTTEAVKEAVAANFEKLDGAAGTVTSVSQGFMGPVAVEMTVDEAGVITAARIGDDSFAEINGAAAADPEYAQKLVGLSHSDMGTGVYQGTNAEGKAVGYVSVGTVTGFGGPVEITVGLDNETTLTGIRVGGASFSETAGLGAKSKEPAFYEQFAGKSYPVDLSKNGGEIDAITAATITSSAVVRGVNNTVKAMAEAAGIKLSEPVAAIEELGEGRYGVTAQGVSGPFPVVVTVDGEGAVVSVEVQDTAAANDVSYLGKVQGNAAYLAQFNGSKALDAAALDTVSGATVSSSSVNESVSKALLYVNDPAAYAALTADTGEEADIAIRRGASVWTAEGKGLNGIFPVAISVDENAVITGIAVGDSESDMDAAFLGQVKNNNAFLAQFVGKNEKVAADAIDMVSGATISSKGVLTAVNKAWNASQGIEEAPAPEVGIAEGAVTYTAAGKGLTGSFDVTISVDEDGAVNGIAVGDASTAEDAGFLGQVKDNAEFLAQFIGTKGGVDAKDIETVSGATVSSKGVIAAVNAAWNASQGITDEKPAAAPAAEGNTVKASGLTGSFDVTVELNEDGTVKAVTLGESDSDMDKNFLSMLNDDFLAQFAGKTLPVEGADTVSGATVSSKAVIEAVNSFAAAAPAAEGNTVKASGLTGSVDVTVELNEDGTVKAVTLGETMGMNAPITVTVTVKNGVVSEVNVEGTSSEADVPYVAKTQDEAFVKQFAGLAAEAAESDIDFVSGATVSSRAVLKAVNLIVDAAAPEAPAEEAKAEPAAEPAAEATGDLKDGVYETAAMGMNAPVTVTVTVKNGVVSEVTVEGTSSEADVPYVARTQDEAFLAQFAGLAATAAEGDIDFVSGATVSSRAVLKAVNLIVDAAD